MTKQIVSSTYIFQEAGCCDKVWIKIFFYSIKNIPDNTEPNGEPIVTPLVWTEVLPSKVKCTPLYIAE